jgi:hypothetical protein
LIIIIICNIALSEATCHVWHEGIAGRGANEIASCIKDYLQTQSMSSKLTEVIFYSDNCSGQNRNKYMAVGLLYFVNNSDIEKITLKFLEAGSTQNEGDYVHSINENAKKRLNLQMQFT